MTSTRTVRTVAAAAVLVSAYVHLYEWLNGFRHDNVMGPLFAVNVVAGVVIAVLLFTWQHWLVPFLAFGFGASTLGGFAIATTSAGLFGTHEKWQGAYVWLAAVSEAVAIIAGLVALSREYRRTPARQEGRASTLAR
jgi:asparagine N-glycosylation enzyme membrane subunit Stt3